MTWKITTSNTKNLLQARMNGREMASKFADCCFNTELLLWVKIDSGNDLLPDRAKPLPESVLT